MRISITFSAAVLALATVASSCNTSGGKSAHREKVYLVGVAGGG